MLIEGRTNYRPILYPKAEEYFLTQHLSHWLWTEFGMQGDLQDFNTNLTPAERNIVTVILKLFTQTEIEVQKEYWSKVPLWFPHPEIAMMANAFADFECFDNQTELLTSNGWKFCKDLTEYDKVAQYDLLSQHITFVLPTQIMSYDYEGVMHLYKTNSTNICVTPNHDLITIHPASKKVTKRKSDKSTLGNNYSYPTSGKGVGASGSLSVLERILIAAQADGCLRGNCPSAEGRDWRRCDLDLTKDRKITRIKSLLDEAGIAYYVHDKERCGANRQTISFSIPDDIDIKNIKNLGFLDLESMSQQKACEVLEEALLWDGSVGHYYYSTNFEAVNKLQAVGVLAGKTTCIGVNRDEEAALSVNLPQGGHPKTAKVCYVLSISDRSTRTYPHRELVNYNGKVYCVSVPTENIVSRREGRVAITGNSIHVKSYSYLNDSLNLPDSIYTEFLSNKVLSAKINNLLHERDVATSLAVFSAFTEGVSLFSSFAILLNFSRFNLLKSVGKIITASIKDECYSDDTEVLTPAGWQLLKDVDLTTNIAQYNPSSKLISFVKPTKLMSYEVDGELYNFKSTRGAMNLSVTPNHRMLINGKGGNGYKFEYASSANYSKDNALPTAGYANAKDKTKSKLTLIEQLRVLLGCFRTTIDETTITISIDNPQRKAKLTEFLDSFPYKYSKTNKSDLSLFTTFVITVPQGHDFSNRYNWIDYSTVTSEWCVDFIYHVAQWTACLATDNSVIYTTSCPININTLQAIAVLGGYYTNVSRTKVDDYYIYINRGTSIPGSSITKSLEEYKGMVYCVAVPTGALVVRRNNNVCISGNSLHSEAGCWLFRQYIQENPHLWTDELKATIYQAARDIVTYEDAFIDEAFKLGNARGITAEDIKLYIRHRANTKLGDLGLKTNWRNLKPHTLDWFSVLTASNQMQDSFANRNTVYNKSTIDFSDIII